MRAYAPINKMESQPDGTIKVWGIASSECVDHDGDIITAEAMKAALPAYMEWGAIREMHQPIAAGTCLEAHVDDATGQTMICAHIVDESSVKKVQAGVLKGFSIGGNKTATDPLNKQKITGLALNEISLVDKPANPEAAITIWKADNMSTTNQAAAPAVTGEQLGNEIEAIVKGGSMSIADLMEAVRKAAEAKSEDKCAHGIMKGETCAKCDGGIAKRYFTEEQRHDAATAGQAMPDGSFPIENTEDLKNAIKAHGRAKDPEAAKKHIIARAKDLGAESELPDDWKDGGGDADESGKGEAKKGAGLAAGSAAGNTGDAGAAPSGAEGAEAVGKAASASEVTKADHAETQMLEKPKVGDEVHFMWGTDEAMGVITELGADGNTYRVQNGDAFVAVDGAMLNHREIEGDKVKWKVTVAENADFTTAKGAAAGSLRKVANGDELKKGMWTVSSFADVLQSIVWLQKDIKWEGEAEEDPTDADLATRIALWLKDGAAMLVEYTKNETQELLTGVADPDNMDAFILELAAKPGELKKFAEGKGAVIQKAAVTGDTITKAMVSDIVKAAVSEALVDVQKAHASEIDGLKKQLKELAEAELPVVGALKGVPVQKGSDTAGAAAEAAPVVVNGKVDEAATEFKKAFQNPNQMNRLSTQ